MKSIDLDKYTAGWIKSLSNEDWEKEREIIRMEGANYDGDWDKALRLEEILYIFDEVMSDRQWGDEPEEYPKHTKHGWYLSDD